jgi:hypothetical protein
LKDRRPAGRFVGMSPRRISRSFRASIGALLGRLALAIAAAVAVPAARADPLPDDSVTLPGPPSYPEDTHVFNGCHLSTIRYLARYLSEFPGESGMPLLIKMRNADGPKRMHTLALVSWKGQAWCRDEYFGVFALGCPYEAQPNLKRLVSKAEILLERHAQTMVRTSGKPLRPNAPEQMSPEQRIRAVKAAVGIIPYPSTIFWVQCGHQELPVAFFRGEGRQVGVYEPNCGTCLAECSIRDDAKVVSLVAARLGYRPEGIRRELRIPAGSLLAAAGAAR